MGFSDKFGKTFEKESPDDYWFVTTKGQYIKVGIFTAIAFVPPFYCYIRNGPLLEQTFNMDYKVNAKLPEQLNKIIDKVNLLAYYNCDQGICKSY